MIREPTTTVVVYPGSRALVTDAGNYLIEVDPHGDVLGAETHQTSEVTA